MLSKKSIILMLSIALTSSILKANVGENKLIAKNKVNIEASNSQNALIIKSTTSCNVQIIDESNQTVLTSEIEKGTNNLSLKNIKAAKYKVIVTDGVFSIMRKLSVR